MVHLIFFCLFYYFPIYTLCTNKTELFFFPYTHHYTFGHVSTSDNTFNAIKFYQI